MTHSMWTFGSEIQTAVHCKLAFNLANILIIIHNRVPCPFFFVLILKFKYLINES